MHAHLEDLRAEIEDLEGEPLEQFLHQVGEDWRTADLGPADAALCAYTEKLTRTPAEMTAADAQQLRDAGFSDEAIHDAIQVVGYFNYINRVADAVHVDLEPEMPPYPRD